VSTRRGEEVERASRRSHASFVALVCLALVVTTSVPYVYCRLTAPPGQVFGGLVLNIADSNVYFMWMRQIADGAVLCRDLTTTDPQRPFFLNSLWLLLGVIGRSGVSLAALYEAARIIFMVLQVVALYALLGVFLPQPRLRRVALVAICFGGGVVFLFALADIPGHDGGNVGTGALGSPEVLAWPQMASMPHFSAGMACLLGVFYFALAAYRDGRARHALVAGSLAVLLASFHLYDLAIVAAAVVAHLVIATRAGRAQRRDWALGALIVIPGLALAVVLARMITGTAHGQHWALQNTLPAPSPFVWAVGLGLPVALALFDHRRILHWSEQDLVALFLPAWLIGHALINFTDTLIPFERRMIMGLQIPLVVLAVQNWDGLVAPWLQDVGGRWFGGQRAAVALWLLPVLLLPDTALWGLVAAGVKGPEHVRTVDRDLLDACAVLYERPDCTGCLCNGESGNWVPRFSGRAVYAGHYAQTPRFGERCAEVARFFAAGTTETARRELLRRARCNYVLASTAEAAGLAPAVASGLLRVELRRPRCVLYCVVGDG